MNEAEVRVFRSMVEFSFLCLEVRVLLEHGGGWSEVLPSPWGDSVLNVAVSTPSRGRGSGTSPGHKTFEICLVDCVLGASHGHVEV